MGLSTGEYGMVVSSFAFAKMVGNVPSAILVERHGRKPYLVYSLSLVGLSVFGISLAQSLEHLMLCRLVTGLGVAALSTAGTLAVADISTPRNRAATIAPTMSGFAAGMCIGPAIGGELADTVGVQATFGIVGVSFLTIAGLNSYLLSETKRNDRLGGIPGFFVDDKVPWRDDAEKKEILKALAPPTPPGVFASMKDALKQQTELLSDPKIRNIVIMNGFYWITLSGSQMTLLPLMLTSPDYGDAMSASSVGKVYMGMSLVQVLANPIVGMIVDKIGKNKAIVGGTTLISGMILSLPSVLTLTSTSALPSKGSAVDVVDIANNLHGLHDFGYYGLAGTMGLWALGGTILSTAPVAYISDIVHDKRRAQAIALLRTAGDIGFFVGAATTGALADFSGSLDSAMHSSAAVLFTATTWFGARQFYMKDQLKAK